MRKKIHSYLGFAKRTGKLLAGYNTCEMAIGRGKAKLIILSGDASENTRKRFLKLGRDAGIPVYIYGDGDDVPAYTGSDGRTVFCVTDRHFADIIEKEIILEMKEDKKMQQE